MPVRRALVDCAVLSLQDTCVFYPYCKGCFSRIDVQQPHDTTRRRCSKCGYSYLREEVDYRYRLSLRVARDSRIFGVTVFGTCLDLFFGIHARGLQRLVEDLDAPVDAPTRSTLLVKAVQDCFIGRHLIFGIKVSHAENGPLFGGSVSNGSSKDTAQFIASQIIVPNATALGGCTVISYYRILLQKAAEYLLGSTDSSKPPATTLLLSPRHSPASSFNNTALPASLSPLHHDCTLGPTPPWQQSLGLVTSSAEQEESSRTEDIGDENSRQIHNERPLHAPVWQRGCWEKHEVTEESIPSPLLSLHESNNQSFTNSSDKADGNTPSQPGRRGTLPLCSKVNGFSDREQNSEQTKASLSTSVAWGDLPFSESLSAFLCEEDRVLERLETEPDFIANNQKGATTSDTSVQSQDKNSNESVSLCQSNTRLTDGLSNRRILLDITNTAAISYGADVPLDLADHTYSDPDGCENRCPVSEVCSDECKWEDEQLGLCEDVYDCSADLFNSSLISTNTLTLNTHAETGRKMPGTHRKRHSLIPDKQGLKSIDNLQSLGTQDLNGIFNDTMQCDDSQPLDFIPPSQSTPIVKVAVVSGLPTSTRRTYILGECSLKSDRRDFNFNRPGLNSATPDKITSSLCELNSFTASQLHQCDREWAEQNLVYTPKRKSRKLDEPKHLLAHKHLRLQRQRALNRGSTERTNHMPDTSICDVSVCDYEVSKIMVPSTPTKTQLPVKSRLRGQLDNYSGYARKGHQTDGVNWKKTLLDHVPSPSQTGVAQRQTDDGVCSQPGSSERAESHINPVCSSVDEQSLNGSKCHCSHDENGACDWSQDLFSDSV